jgi:hypothetical protein
MDCVGLFIVFFDEFAPGRLCYYYQLLGIGLPGSGMSPQGACETGRCRTVAAQLSSNAMLIVSAPSIDAM